MKAQGMITAGLLVVAGLALWLLLAGPSRILGVDSGNLGVMLLMTTAWVSLYAISRMPRDAGQEGMSPGEWRAWLGVGFMLVASVYFLGHVRVFGQGSAWNNPDASRVGRNLVLLLIAWTVLSGVMASRWRGLVQEDERDRLIERHALGWGRTGLVVFVIGLALMLGFSPPDRLQWATHFMIANLLVFALMLGLLVEYVATGLHYWRDRR